MSYNIRFAVKVIRTIARFKNVVMDRWSGNISFQIDDFVQQHLFDLRANYTQSQLIDIPTFQSKYAIKLHAIIKSFLYSNDGEQYLEHLSIDICFSVEDLKCMFDTSGHTSFGVFLLKVIGKQWRRLTAKVQTCPHSREFEKTGKAITGIVCFVKKKRGAALAFAKQECVKLTLLSYPTKLSPYTYTKDKFLYKLHIKQR